MEREVGGGFRMGNTCTSMADSCECMANPIQYCIVLSYNIVIASYPRSSIFLFSEKADNHLHL